MTKYTPLEEFTPEMEEYIKQWGADRWRMYEGKADWDDLTREFEEAFDCGLPEQWDHPLLTKFKRLYNQGRKETEF